MMGPDGCRAEGPDPGRVRGRVHRALWPGGPREPAPRCEACGKRQVGPVALLAIEVKRSWCARGLSIGNEGMYEHGCDGGIVELELYKDRPPGKREPWR